MISFIIACLYYLLLQYTSGRGQAIGPLCECLGVHVITFELNDL